MSTPIVTIVDPLTWTHGWSYDLEQQLLSERGVDLRVPNDEHERDELVRIADVIISSSLVAVDAAMLDTFEKCAGIVCYSAGMDAVDISHANQLGISVTNVPYNFTEVADHAVTLLLALLRRLPQLSRATEAGDWDHRDIPWLTSIPRLSELTIGIVGAGRAGQAVAQRARAFGMTTIATYHFPPPDPDPELPHVELLDLAARSHAVVLCASLNDDSFQMINASFFDKLQPGCTLVNVGRGALINEDDLLHALDSGQVGAVGLDVRDSEPPEKNDPLASRPEVVQTPHVAGVSSGARRAIHEVAADAVIGLLEASGRLETATSS